MADYERRQHGGYNNRKRRYRGEQPFTLDAALPSRKRS